MNAQIWFDLGKGYVIAESPKIAADALRKELVRQKEIGKFTPVTVELVSAGAVNVYREVW